MRAFLVFVLLAIPAGAAVNDTQLRAIQFDQKVNTRISPELQFRDENGEAVTIGSYLGGKPVILVPGYYGCPMLCTLVLNGLVEALRNLRMTAGKDFDVVCYSINPEETSLLAAAKKRSYIRNYGRGGEGWHFLTGKEASIQRLSSEIGFRYVYDPASRQYAHPSGVVVLTPDGRIARYFFGVDYSARDLDNVLQAAAHGKDSGAIAQLFLLCFHYNPIRGKYGMLIMNCVRGAGLATCAGLGYIIWQGAMRRGS